MGLKCPTLVGLVRPRWNGYERMAMMVTTSEVNGVDHEKSSPMTTNGRQKRRVGWWVKRKIKGLRMSKSRKVKWWKAFYSLVVMPRRRIVKVYEEILKNLDAIYPTLVFTTNWGLPVVSHSSHKHFSYSNYPCT